MEFLRKHYEKIVLCVVLLGLAGAVVWMRSALENVHAQLQTALSLPQPKNTPPDKLDLTVYQQALAQIRNPPLVALSGAHNLFNPVTWKLKANGELVKIMKTGPDALALIKTIPLYTIISYEHPTPDSPIYAMSVQQHVDLRQPAARTKTEYARKNEKTKSGLYIVRGIKGTENDPSEINLEILQTGESNVWVTTNSPYKRVDTYVADLKYDPDPTLPLLKRKVGDEFNLDNERYIIVEITNDAVRVQNVHTTKVTVVKSAKSEIK